MKNQQLNFNNKIKLKVKKKTINKLTKKFKKIFSDLKRDIKDDNHALSTLNNNFKFDFNFSDLKKFKKYKNIAIIGMGGSILGSKAIYYFLKKKINKSFYFFDNIDEEQLNYLKKKDDLNKVLFIIISKSGNTLETLSNVFSLGIIKKNKKNLIIISEEKNNLLYQLSKKYSLHFIKHKDFIGGRYSVLSEVGIVPAYLMGLNIKKLSSNLSVFLNKQRKEFLKKSSIILSSILVRKKYKNLIFLNYSPELENFLFWLQQLIAESLGKKNKGFLPLISKSPKDHHSLLQLYLDGPKDNIFYIFSVDTKSKIKINTPKKMDIDHINKKYLSEIKNAQKNAMVKALTEKKLPFREFKIKKIDELALGKLFSYFILETVIIGKLSNINPYDQPAVEQVKVYTKKILNRNSRK